MNFFIIFLLLHSIAYITNCHDIQIEGMVQISNDLLKKIQMAVMKQRKPNVTDNVISHSDLVDHSLEFRRPSQRRVLALDSMKLPIKTCHIADITYIGVDKIKEVGKYLQNKYGFNITVTEDAAIESYRKMIQNYTENATRHAINATLSKVDTEYLVLYITEISNILLYTEINKMLNEVLQEDKVFKKYNVEFITEKIHGDCEKHKKDVLKYVCDSIFICRPYPGFSHFLVQFITEILKLPKTKMTAFVNNFQKVFTNKADLIKRVIDEELLNLICTKLQTMYDENIENLRHFLTSVRLTLSRRYKLLPTEDENAIAKAKAIKILTDMLDKSFAIDGEDLLSITFHSLSKTLSQWTADEKIDIRTTLNNFFKYIIDTFKYQWDDEIKKDVQCCLEVIIYGQSRDLARQGYLFSRGSTLLRGESLHSDIDV